jgi:SOS-response transcriptional repressor LexA
MKSHPQPTLTLKPSTQIGLDTLGFRPTPRTFALQVQDDAMEERHILPGDVLIFENGITPRSNDIVAALMHNESLVRTYRVERGRGWLLTAHSQTQQSLPASGLLIQGVMRRLIRRIT